MLDRVYSLKLCCCGAIGSTSTSTIQRRGLIERVCPKGFPVFFHHFKMDLNVGLCEGWGCHFSQAVLTENGPEELRPSRAGARCPFFACIVIQQPLSCDASPFPLRTKHPSLQPPYLPSRPVSLNISPFLNIQQCHPLPLPHLFQSIPNNPRLNIHPFLLPLLHLYPNPTFDGQK